MAAPTATVLCKDGRKDLRHRNGAAKGQPVKRGMARRPRMSGEPKPSQIALVGPGRVRGGPGAWIGKGLGQACSNYVEAFAKAAPPLVI